MNLRVYLATVNMSAKDFSELVGCDHHYISSICSGRKFPSIRLAKRIMSATGGQVTVLASDKKPGRKPKPKKPLLCENCKCQILKNTIENIPV